MQPYRRLRIRQQQQCPQQRKLDSIQMTFKESPSSCHHLTSDSHCADHEHRVGRFRRRSFGVVVIIIRGRRGASRARPSARPVREAIAKLSTCSALRGSACLRWYDIPEQLRRHRLPKSDVSSSTLDKLDSSEWISVDLQVLGVSKLFLL